MSDGVTMYMSSGGVSSNIRQIFQKRAYQQDTIYRENVAFKCI